MTDGEDIPSTPTFAKALAYTLEREKGYVNHPQDRGGPTNLGITLATLSAWRGYKVTPKDVEQLQRSEASLIYYRKYWKALHLDELKAASIAVAIFDASVLFGVGASALACQKALILCGTFNLALDGHIGPATLTALKAIDPLKFLTAFRNVLNTKIIAIATARLEDRTFQHGWEHRVADYANLI